jgi:hypothetical protein
MLGRRCDTRNQKGAIRRLGIYVVAPASTRDCGRAPLPGSDAFLFWGGGLNRSTQHFVLEGKDGVWDGTKISQSPLYPQRTDIGSLGSQFRKVP